MSIFTLAKDGILIVPSEFCVIGWLVISFILCFVFVGWITHKIYVRTLIGILIKGVPMTDKKLLNLRKHPELDPYFFLYFALQC